MHRSLPALLVVTLLPVKQATAQTPSSQLDRIEQKLDTILRHLDQRPSASAVTGERSPTAATAPAAPETMQAGAIAIAHPAPAHANTAREIPADSIGGFIYTGGQLQLADLADHGVRYTGLVGIEWQGWLRAKESGRYQLAVEGSTVSPNAFTTPTCVFTGWLEDRPLAAQDTTPLSQPAHPKPFSLVLGMELQPGLYKLRLWATCTPSARDQHVAIALLEKSPADLNLRPITANDLAHKQR